MQVLEVPVELHLLEDTVEEGVQVDLFESPKNSERAEEVGALNRYMA